MGGLSPSYSVRHKAFFVIFSVSSYTELTLWRLLQGDSKDVKFVVGDEVDPGLNRSTGMQFTGGSVHAGGSVAVEEGEGASSDGEENSPDPLPTERSSHDGDEDLKIRLVRKRKVKPPPSTKDASELPLAGVKGSLSMHMRSTILVSAPLFGSSHDPIETPTSPSSSRVRDKTLEVSIARIASAFEVSPHHATGTSKPSQFEGLVHRSPLVPLFDDALLFTYVLKWKITHSSVIGTPETARDFLSHVVHPFHKFMNSALRDDLFEDQYSMSLCESFFRGVGMLQRVDDLWKANEGLKGELRASQSVAAELRCQVVEAE
ncbi:hypothetical protein Hanom_Chr11g00990931 [Helianthus anomalus]